MPSLEIACFNPTSALIAFRNGASRIEFCSGASVGGTTPLLSDFVTLRSQVSVPVYVMIRPRGGSFLYTADEFDQMKRELLEFKKEGADGFVFGILNAEGRVESEKCKVLVELAGERACTYHRAFDEVKEEDMEEALNDIVSCGFKSILTSGGKETAKSGAGMLEKLVKVAGKRIDIIVGGSVRSSVLNDLRAKTSALWFHSSAIIDGGEIANADEITALAAALKSD